MKHIVQRIKSNLVQLLFSVLIAVSRTISDCLFWLQPEDKSNKDINDFLPLTPTLLSKSDIAEYEVQLDNALQGKICKQISNIAVSGSYAVGKSSFIRTFIYHHAEYRHTPIISMAKFSAQSEEGEPEAIKADVPEPAVNGQKLATKDRKKLLEQIEIEKSILEQLVYSAKPETLPLSKFKRLRETPKRFVLFVVLLVASIVLLLAELMGVMTPSHTEVNGYQINVRWLSLSYIALFLAYMLQPFINTIRSYSITKFSWRGMDFEKQHHRSFLRENVDEFIYFFDKTKVRLVVFEDIDRLEPLQAMAILTHIREVNRLVNLNRTTPIFFIYAVKDDLFKAEERTKFFDLIIPIVPVINSNNAYEMLAKALGLESDNRSSSGDLTKQLVKDVSLFFGDLRLIYNLVNEYKLYKSKLSKSHQLDLNKLFALLVVKTMYPSVYTQLLINQGLISDVVSRFPEAKAAIASDLCSRKESITKLLSDKRELITKRRKELLLSFWVNFSESSNISSFPTNIEISGIALDLVSAIEPGSEFEMFMLGERGNRASVFYWANYSRYSAGSFMHPESLKNIDGLTYRQCRDLIDINNTSLEAELSDLSVQLRQIGNYRLKDLISEEHARKVLLEPLGNEYDVIKYLFLHGYIGEDYSDYTSFFYPGTITQEDKVKVQQIKLLNKLQLDTLFDKPKEVLEQLQPQDLEGGRGLLKSLIPELLKTENSAKLEAALSKSSAFASELTTIWLDLSAVTDRQELLNRLLDSDLSAAIAMLKLLESSSEYGEELKRQFIIELLSDTDNLNQVKLESVETFCKTVSGLTNLHDFEAIRSDWFWESNKIKYFRLNRVPEILAEKIRNSGQFEMNKTTLTTLLDHEFGENTYSVMSYQSVLSSKSSSFIQKIDDHILSFFELLKESERWRESYDSSLQILAKLNLPVEDKLAAAKSVGKTFGSDVIPENCLLLFISNDLLDVSLGEVWAVKNKLNSMQIATPKEVRKVMSEFVDRHIASLVSEINDIGLDDDYLVYLLELETSETTFHTLLNSQAFEIDVLVRLDLPENRWLTLIDAGLYTYSDDLFSVVQQKSKKAAAKLLLKGWPRRYNLSLEKGSILQETGIYILQSQSIEIKEKLRVNRELGNIDYTNYASLAEEIVDNALKLGLSLAPVANSLVNQVKRSQKTELRAKVALHFISEKNTNFAEACEILSSFKVQGLQNFITMPSYLIVQDALVYRELLNRLHILGFVGKVKSESEGKLKAYVRPSMCSN